MSASDKPVESGLPPAPAADSISKSKEKDDQIIVYRRPPTNVLEAYFSKEVNGPLGNLFSIDAIKYFGRNLVNQDLKAGIAVAFISLPLSVALAIASGGTPLMGLATASCEINCLSISSFSIKCDCC